MASLAQSESGGYFPVVVEGMRFSDSLRFHARLDVRTQDHTSSWVMAILTQARRIRKMTPKERLSYLKEILGQG